MNEDLQMSQAPNPDELFNRLYDDFHYGEVIIMEQLMATEYYLNSSIYYREKLENWLDDLIEKKQQLRDQPFIEPSERADDNDDFEQYFPEPEYIDEFDRLYDEFGHGKTTRMAELMATEYYLAAPTEIRYQLENCLESLMGGYKPFFNKTIGDDFISEEQSPF